MRIMWIGLCGLVGLASPAWAEDFTGFYAGVNAGYGFQSEKGTPRGIGPDARRAADSAVAIDRLPPSAQSASRGLRERNRLGPDVVAPTR